MNCFNTKYRFLNMQFFWIRAKQRFSLLGLLFLLKYWLNDVRVLSAPFILFEICKQVICSVPRVFNHRAIRMMFFIFLLMRLRLMLRHMILLWCITIFVTSLLLFEFSDLLTVVATVEVPLDLRLFLHFIPLDSQLYLVVEVVLCLQNETAILSVKDFSQFFQEILFKVTGWLGLIKKLFVVLQ